jgi:hypothetical protein
MIVFWDVATCNLVEIGDRPDDGGSKHLWNFGQFLRAYTAQDPRRQLSSYFPPWEPEISLNIILGLYLQIMQHNRFFYVLLLL